MAVEATPFADVFPGESIRLSTGELITIGPLGAFTVTHELPALIGQIAGKLSHLPITDAEEARKHLGEIYAIAGPELADLLCHVTGLNPERLKKPPPAGITAEELIDLVIAFLRHNTGFFAKIALLRGFVRTEFAPAGRASSLNSSGTDSESKN